ncbi:helix-turn-helix domain-containing protein [Streptomyces mirabilis]|uniref:helix-turn-helix domain-containing protein n=1 Tax=Streptomyces TaxID=1883 RepID=UPI00211C6135|nr:helix-turn-helix domain-containing protein [Streptomyces sp. Ag82_O1-15]
MDRSFRAAGRLLEADCGYGLRGVYDLSDLSWRVAVVATVRYRLRRVEELTGTSLDAPDTAVEFS